MKNKKKKPINVEFGKNLKFYRERAGYSREKLSELMGVTPNFILDMETGFIDVSITNLKHICELLGISADKLIWSDRGELKLDERVFHLDKKYVTVLERMIQVQLEVIFENDRDYAERRIKD